MTTAQKESKARKLLVTAQMAAIEAGRLLDGHAALIPLDQSIKQLDDAIDWLPEQKKSGGGN